MTIDDIREESLISEAANIRFGTNEVYTINDFAGVYPQLADNVPLAALQMYINLASSCLSQERWCDMWQVGMSLFVAHFATLYLQSTSLADSPTAAQVANAGVSKGILVSKSVGDVSSSYQSIVSDINGWAAWKLTSFGQQLITMARLVGMGGSYIW